MANVTCSAVDIPLGAFVCIHRALLHTCRALIMKTRAFWALVIEYVGTRGGGLGSSTIFKRFNEPYAPS